MTTILNPTSRRGITVLYGGRQGATGSQGPQGPVGPQGKSITSRGAWSSGATYAPGDAVSADSTAAAGITSLFIQRGGAVTAVSTTPPRDDPARWMEVGAQNLDAVTGAIWTVQQSGHGFTEIGTPVGYNAGADRWVATSNLLSDEPAVALVRDIPDANTVVLQTTGKITNLDPAVIIPGVAQFLTGALYYVADARGYLTSNRPSQHNAQSVNPVLLATGPTSGVVLQWQAIPNIVGRRPVGTTSYFYTATAAQTVFTGADLDGNVLDYVPSDQTRVLVDGIDISSRGGFTATDGTTVVLAVGATLGAEVEIRVLAEALNPIAAATSLYVDNISGLFDGVRTVFPLTVNSGDDVDLAPTPNTLIWLDGNTLEPFADYVVTLPGLGVGSEIVFTAPPEPGTRFWALTGVAISGP
jgi:hypothetical protein